MESLAPAALAANHLAVTDALLRFGAGTDEGDRDILLSAFAEDTVVDFGPCGQKLGLDVEPLTGREAVVGFLAGTSAQQVTSHLVSNARVVVSGERASLRALVEATHVVRAAPDQRFRMMNRCDAELGWQADAWRIERLVIDNIWFEGDPRTILLR